MNMSPALLLAHITPFQCLGGIVFPEIAKKKPQKGTVITVGPGRIDDNGKRIEMEVKAGDVVLYTRFNSTEIQIDDRKLLIQGKRDSGGC